MLFVFWAMSRREAFEKSLASSCIGGKLIHFVEQMRYDETPMKMKCLEVFKSLVEGEQPDKKQATVAVMGAPTTSVQMQLRSTSTKKILQTDASCGAVLELRDGLLMLLMAVFRHLCS